MSEPDVAGRRARRGLLPLALIGAALLVAIGLLATGPSAERRDEAPEPPAVAVVPLASGPYPRIAEAFGTVVAARRVVLSPEVAGRVVELHPQLDPGGIVRAGELLLRIDPSEYELAVAAAEAALAEAEAALAIEQGRQVVARREWELFGQELPDAARGSQLALRGPQLRQAEARIASARSALDRARLDLRRTRIDAPFDALVVREAVEVGQRVDAQALAAELAGVEAFWVQASLPLSRLQAVIEGGASGRPARVVLETGLGQRVERPGRLLRQLGSVDPDGRMGQVLIEIEDPLGLAGGPVLPLGSYVRVELDAGVLEQAVSVPRAGLRENGEVWLVDAEDRLVIRRVEVLWRQGDELAVGDVFAPAERLVVSPLASPVPGARVRPRLAGPAPETLGAAEDEPADAG